MNHTQALNSAVASRDDSSVLEQIFGQCFFAEFNTRLIGGYDEPLYQPESQAGGAALIQYRADYFASALHEVAHWCIAGAARRLRVDYGYWYAPDGRDVNVQRQFESVEYKPQALEWFFAKASGYRFKLSIDNLADDNIDTRDFKQAVWEQAQYWQLNGLPLRAQRFCAALQKQFFPEHNTPGHKSLEFALAELC
jgi:elongation factor P hydroxylase